MRLTSILSLFVCLISSASVVAQNSKGGDKGLAFTFGAGVISSPTYLGDDDYQTSVFPSIALAYGERLKVSMRGIEYVAMSKGGWKIGPTLGYDFGREERADGPFAISGEPSTDLDGLGDVDGTLELGGFVEYAAGPLSVNLKLRKGMDGGHDGLVGGAGVSFRGRIKAFGSFAFFSIGPAISFGDDLYNSAYFDVSALQSAASGISEYDTDGGLNTLGLHSSIMIPLTKKTSLVSFINVDQLKGDIGESTIVSERGSRDQTSVGLFINYKL